MALQFKPIATITPDMVNGFLWVVLFIIVAAAGFYAILKYYDLV